jgi:hypothetical protein
VPAIHTLAVHHIPVHVCRFVHATLTHQVAAVAAVAGTGIPVSLIFKKQVFRTIEENKTFSLNN